MYECYCDGNQVFLIFTHPTMPSHISSSAVVKLRLVELESDYFKLHIQWPNYSQGLLIRRENLIKYPNLRKSPSLDWVTRIANQTSFRPQNCHIQRTKSIFFRTFVHCTSSLVTSVSMSHSGIFWNTELILTMGWKPGWFCKKHWKHETHNLPFCWSFSNKYHSHHSWVFYADS